MLGRCATRPTFDQQRDHVGLVLLPSGEAWFAAAKGRDSDFTVADFNVASILSWARPARIDLSGVPKMADWLQRCALRPAAKAARELQR
jgi:glutathione S-transferase